MPSVIFSLMQSIVFSLPDQIKGMEKLYYKGENFSLSNRIAYIKKNGTLDFFSYFNIFNSGKWERYTGIQSFYLRLHLSGRFRIRVYRHHCSHFSESPWHDNKFDVDGWITIPLMQTDGRDIYSVKIDAMEDGIFYGGGWYNEKLPESGADCRIAIVICTYKREHYLLRNLNVLSACLPDNWEVFVIDNGYTMTEEFAGRFDDRFHFFNNPNTGGTGGFTQGLIEAMNHERKCTHVLLMDDDVLIEPAALERTDTLIRLLKPEYQNHFLGGAMLRLDIPYIQHESGAYWNGIRIKQLRHNFDLSKPRYILANTRTINKKSQYAAWWYCVIPLTDNTINNLPVPLFINGDDIEYSIRRAHGIILLNGIAVWHQPFHLKYNPVKQYYFTVRNSLIINVRHGYSLITSIALVWLRFLFQLSKLHIFEARLVVKGLSDFLKGPGYLRIMNTAELLSSNSHEIMINKKLHAGNLIRHTILLAWKHGFYRRAYVDMPLRDHEWHEINHGKQKIAKPASDFKIPLEAYSNSPLSNYEG